MECFSEPSDCEMSCIEIKPMETDAHPQIVVKKEEDCTDGLGLPIFVRLNL